MTTQFPICVGASGASCSPWRSSTVAGGRERRRCATISMERGKMSAESRINRKVADVYGVGSPNVYRGTDYDGVRQAFGWWYRPFGSNPIFLGASEAEALEMLEQVAESRREAAQGIG